MRLENIHISFDPRGIAGLHGLSLELKTGQILGIMGPSGAGKSTLLRVLSGELRPLKGTAHLPDRVALMELREHYSEDLTTQDWLMSGVKRKIEQEKKLQLARDLAEAFEFPMQLKLRLTQLSEGQRQRARLAYALIDHPELLLLDEPFAHLDSPLRHELMLLLKSYVKARDITVVHVTHDLEEALGLSDKLGILHFGKFEQLASPQDVYWRPKNLLVAKLMGHENFVTVSRQNPTELWATPFGSWNSDGAGHYKTHLVLSLPATAFEVHPRGLWAGKVEEVQFLGAHWLVKVKTEAHSWLISWPGRKNSPQIAETCRFNVDLSQGVAIDCL